MRRERSISSFDHGGEDSGESLPVFETGLTAIARFNNAAEAGYFAHEMHTEAGITARVMTEDDFDAVGGVWSTRFLLVVPRDQAGPALAVLRHQLEEPDDMTDSRPSGQRWSVASAQSAAATHYRNHARAPEPSIAVLVQRMLQPTAGLDEWPRWRCHQPEPDRRGPKRRCSGQ